MENIKKKKYLIIVCLIIALLLMFFLMFRTPFMSFFSPKEENDYYDDAIVILNEKVPTNVYLFGEDMYFRDSVKYTKIENISKEVLSGEDKIVLIINDMNGTVSLNEDEWKFIQEKKKDYDFYFYYVGRNLLSEFEKRKIFSNIQESDLCTGVVTCEGKRLEFVVYNIEDKKVADKHNNKEMLGSYILENVAYCYDSNN